MTIPNPTVRWIHSFWYSIIEHSHDPSGWASYGIFLPSRLDWATLLSWSFLCGRYQERWHHQTQELKITEIHPGRVTWNLQITHLERKNDLQNLHCCVPCYIIFRGVYISSDKRCKTMQNIHIVFKQKPQNIFVWKVFSPHSATHIHCEELHKAITNTHN